MCKNLKPEYVVEYGECIMCDTMCNSEDNVMIEIDADNVEFYCDECVGETDLYGCEKCGQYFAADHHNFGPEEDSRIMCDDCLGDTEIKYPCHLCDDHFGSDDMNVFNEGDTFICDDCYEFKFRDQKEAFIMFVELKLQNIGEGDTLMNVVERLQELKYLSDEGLDKRFDWYKGYGEDYIKAFFGIEEE